MPAYLISDVTVKDQVAFRNYRTRAAASIAQYGGRYLARVGGIETLEGDWSPRTLIIVEFPIAIGRRHGTARRNTPKH
jgi:uncharacterized protein (DUF1330 family)